MDTQPYIEPLKDVVRTMGELFSLPGERELADRCIEYFIATLAQDDRDERALRARYRRLGYQMFVWKYYRAARHYCGGMKALSAHLYLRSL